MRFHWIISTVTALVLLVGIQGWLNAKSVSRYTAVGIDVELFAEEVTATDGGDHLTLTDNVKISATLPNRDKGQAPVTLEGSAQKMTYARAKSGNTAVLHSVSGVAPNVTMTDPGNGNSVLTGTTITITQPTSGGAMTVAVDGNVKFRSDANRTVVTCRHLDGKVTAKGMMETLNARGDVVVNATRARTDGDTEKLFATAALMNYVQENGRAIAYLKSEGATQPKIVVTRIAKEQLGTPTTPDVWDITSSWIRYDLTTGDYTLR